MYLSPIERAERFETEVLAQLDTYSRDADPVASVKAFALEVVAYCKKIPEEVDGIPSITTCGDVMYARQCVLTFLVGAESENYGSQDDLEKLNKAKSNKFLGRVRIIIQSSSSLREALVLHIQWFDKNKASAPLSSDHMKVLAKPDITARELNFIVESIVVLRAETGG